MTYEVASVQDLIQTLIDAWYARDPSSDQNRLTIFIWLFVTGFTGTAAWRAKYRWMRLSMLITNQAVMLAMMATDFQKLLIIMAHPLWCGVVLLVAIALAAFLFRFRKPKVFRELEHAQRRQERQEAELAAREQDALSQQEVRQISNQWVESAPGGNPPQPGQTPPTFGRRQ